MNPLDSLHDIVAPEPIGLFPLAPAWWVLLVMLLLGLSLAVFFAIKHWKRARKEERPLLWVDATLREPVSQMSDLTLVVKRAIHYLSPKHPALNLSGPAWCEFLIETMPATEQEDFAAQMHQVEPYLYQTHGTEHTNIYRTLLQRWWAANRGQFKGGLND